MIMRLEKISRILTLGMFALFAQQADAARLGKFVIPSKPLVLMQDEVTAGEEGADDVSGEVVVKTAMQYLGVPYRSGKSSPKGFDCSGFTSFVFKKFSIDLNRDSRSQFTQGTPIQQVSDLRAGDLVFWRGSSRSGGVGHVGIVTEVSKTTGSFKFVHAAIHGGIRVDDSRTAYYVNRYMGARRVIEPQVED